MAEEQDFAFAGLWDRWEGQEKMIESCTIIVTDANEAVGAIHDRMPVILEPADYGHWLDPTVNDISMVKPLLRSWRRNNLVLHPVSKNVNSVKNDYAELIKKSYFATQ